MTPNKINIMPPILYKLKFSPKNKIEKIVTKTIERLVPEYIYSINQSKFDNKVG